MINAERRRKDRQRESGVKQKKKQGQRHLKTEAKVLKSATEDEEVRDGRGGWGWEGTERVNLEFSEAGEGMKLKVAFELRGIYKCKNEQNNQLTCVAINQLVRWHVDRQSA